MVEISDREYWKQMDYYSGVLYCSLLTIDGKNDWRMMNNYQEYVKCKYEYQKIPVSGKWCKNDISCNSNEFLMENNYWVVPVRDV